MNKTTWESTVKPVVVLSVISLVVSLLLAVVNSMTAPVIAENERAATLAAYVDVMPSVSDANTLEEMSGYTTANVSGVDKAQRWQHGHQGRRVRFRRRRPDRYHGL